MPFVNSQRGREPSEEDNLLERSSHKLLRFWEGFVDFAFSGNILQIAFGLMCVEIPSTGDTWTATDLFPVLLLPLRT